jgi:hypothetical protein
MREILKLFNFIQVCKVPAVKSLMGWSYICLTLELVRF